MPRVEISDDIEDTFQRIVKEHVGAVDVLQSAQFSRIRAQIAELGLKYHRRSWQQHITLCRTAD
jgi:hypothetical protein